MYNVSYSRTRQGSVLVEITNTSFKGKLKFYLCQVDGELLLQFVGGQFLKNFSMCEKTGVYCVVTLVMRHVRKMTFIEFINGSIFELGEMYEDGGE